MISTRELYEQASMYVLNLLDDEERQAFEQAYERAAPAVQSQIRREMLRHSDIDDILPNVPPPPGLKRKVIDAVAAIRDAEARQRIARSVGPFTVALQRNVSPIWRAACIALLAGPIVLGFSVHRVSDQFRSIQIAETEGGMLTTVLQSYGARFLDSMLSQEATLVSFAASSNPAPGAAQASLLVDKNAAYLLHRGLAPIDGGYRLVVLEDDGRIGATLAQIQSSGGHGASPVSVEIPAGVRLAIVPYTARTAADAVLVSIVA
jgi:hypothetical protein